MLLVFDAGRVVMNDVVLARQVNADVTAMRGARGERAATSAVHANFVVCGMDSCLHGVSKICVLNHLILKDGRGIQQPAYRQTVPQFTNE